jgi:hypothetical protein
MSVTPRKIGGAVSSVAGNTQDSPAGTPPEKTLMAEQLLAGKLKGTGDVVWFTAAFGSQPYVYQCGSWQPRTPRELFAECLTVLTDLTRNHPELLTEVMEALVTGGLLPLNEGRRLPSTTS